jgi:hypothetical protein
VAAVEEQEARVNEVLNTELVSARKGDDDADRQVYKKKYESNDEG